MIRKNQDNVIPQIVDNSDQLEQVSDQVVAKLTSFPKIGQKIRLVLRDPSVPGVDCAGTVLSRGGKKTGQYRNYYIIEFEKPDACHGVTDCIDFKNDVLLWELSVDEETCLLTVSDEQKAFLSFAKQAEYESWLENEAFEVVTDNHQHCISTKWVTTEKDGTKIKARLVATGFEELGTDDMVRYLPTAAKDSKTIACYNIFVRELGNGLHGRSYGFSQRKKDQP